MEFKGKKQHICIALLIEVSLVIGISFFILNVILRECPRPRAMALPVKFSTLVRFCHLPFNPTNLMGNKNSNIGKIIYKVGDEKIVKGCNYIFYFPSLCLKKKKNWNSFNKFEIPSKIWREIKFFFKLIVGIFVFLWIKNFFLNFIFIFSVGNSSLLITRFKRLKSSLRVLILGYIYNDISFGKTKNF